MDVKIWNKNGKYNENIIERSNTLNDKKGAILKRIHL